jgi:hypothetical protein
MARGAQEHCRGSTLRRKNGSEDTLGVAKIGIDTRGAMRTIMKGTTGKNATQAGMNGIRGGRIIRHTIVITTLYTQDGMMEAKRNGTQCIIGHARVRRIWESEVTIRIRSMMVNIAIMMKSSGTRQRDTGGMGQTTIAEWMGIVEHRQAHKIGIGMAGTGPGTAQMFTTLRLRAGIQITYAKGLNMARRPTPGDLVYLTHPDVLRNRLGVKSVDGCQYKVLKRARWTRRSQFCRCLKPLLSRPNLLLLMRRRRYRRRNLAWIWSTMHRQE